MCLHLGPYGPDLVAVTVYWRVVGWSWRFRLSELEALGRFRQAPGSRDCDHGAWSSPAPELRGCSDSAPTANDFAHYWESQVARNKRPRYPKVAHNGLKVAHNDRPLAFHAWLWGRCNFGWTEGWRGVRCQHFLAPS